VLRCKSTKAIENVNLDCSSKFPLVCTQPNIFIPVIGKLSVIFCILLYQENLASSKILWISFHSWI